MNISEFLSTSDSFLIFFASNTSDSLNYKGMEFFTHTHTINISWGSNLRPLVCSIPFFIELDFVGSPVQLNVVPMSHFI